MTILIVCAMLEEINPVREHFNSQLMDQIGHMKIEQARYKQADIYLVESGIGKSNAAMGVTLGIERFQPDMILNYGLVGALSSDIQPGDIIIPDNFCYHDADETAFGSPLGQIPRMPHSYPLDERLKDLVLKMRKYGSNIKVGQCLSSDSFVHQEKQLNFIREHFPAGIICDMEATALAQVAYTYQLPFLSIKTISDQVEDEAGVDQYLNYKDQLAIDSVDLLFQTIDDLI